MLDSVMTAYHKIRQSLIGAMSGSDGVAYEETRFYDLGYMQTQVSHIKKELRSVEDSLTGSVKNETSTLEVNNYRNDLIKRREALIRLLIFTLSNSLANLDNCKKLADGHDFKFMKCVEGLEEYKSGNKERAFELIEGYYTEYGNFEDHYLVNKVLGLLLYEKKQYDKAIPILSYALGFMPDDGETLKALDECYQQMGEDRKHKVIEDINCLLGY